MKNKTNLFLVFILFLSIIVFLFFKFFYDDFLITKANSCFKKNNLVEAEKYFEKAFALEVNDTKSRDIYVNLLINSPLTIEAQEKLVKFMKMNSKEDSASFKAEAFLYDIKREIHRKYPNNYIINAVYNQKIMRWGKLPITYAFFNTESVPRYYINEIENAFTEWERATEQQVIFEENDNNPNIVIKFEKNNPAQEKYKKYVVAYTKPNVNSDELDNSEIIFYATKPFGEYYSKNEIYNTALHEIVHALGFMGHCEERENIMYLTKDSSDSSNNYRERLTEADINTLKLLYVIKPQITNDDKIPSLYIPELALGKIEDVNSEKIREAEFYIQKAPNLPTGYIDLAEGYVLNKDYPSAIKNLEKALRLADTKEMLEIIYYNLAVTYFKIDHLEIASDYLKKSMEINDNEQKHYLLAEIYIREGNTDKAINEYIYLIKKDSQNIDYYIALANIYVLEHKYVKARNVLKKYYRKNPSDRNNPRFEPYGILNMGL